MQYFQSTTWSYRVRALLRGASGGVMFVVYF